MSEESKTAKTLFSQSVRVQALENTLLQSLTEFQDLVTELEEIYAKSEVYKCQALTLRQKCESESCISSEALKKVIATKEETIQSLANIFKELYEKKDFNIINEAFQIIYGADHQFTLKTEISSREKSLEVSENIIKEEDDSLPLSEVYDYPLSEVLDISPGRKSPIFQSKKSRNASFSTTDSTQLQEKKKCPSSWPTPERKTLKLSFPTPAKGKTNGKFRQGRLSFVKAKTEMVVDLTCSPSACQANDSNFKIIKQESIENDDTILPSPTSGPVNFNLIYKLAAKSSPHKQRKSLSILKLKSKEERLQNNDKENKFIDTDSDTKEFVMDVLKESNRQQKIPGEPRKPLPVSKLITECTTFIDDNDENVLDDESLNNEIMEESVDILRHFPNRFPVSPAKQKNSTPVKLQENNRDDNDESMSVLHQMNRINDVICSPNSPSKRPLSQVEIPSSMSVLRTNLKTRVTASNENLKRTKPVMNDPVFKEPAVRKKAEKLALPGWSCDQCKEFYAELYKDDLEKLREKMDICSRHRARRDPTRPKTPPGFWQARWDVPQDTDEFNLRNDAL